MGVVPHRRHWATTLLLLLLLLTADGAHVDFGNAKEGLRTWELLTADNFTQEIHKHDFSLCITGVPWSGEARSLMNGIVRLLNSEPPTSLAKLKLWFVNGSRDKFLSDLLSGAHSPSFTFFRQNSAFKYNGAQTAQHVLASVRHVMGIPDEDLPWKHVTSSAELEALVQSTDKAVVLVDSCGWGMRALSRTRTHKRQQLASAGSVRQPVLDIDGLLTGEEGWSGELYPGPACQTESAGKTFGLECGDNLSSTHHCGVSGCPQGLASREYDSSGSVEEVGDEMRQPGEEPVTRWLTNEKSACSLAELHKLQDFEAWFHNLTKVASAHALTPHRAQFAIVSEEKVAIDAGFLIPQDQPWLLTAKVHDFNCTPRIFNGEGDVEDFLSSLSPLVRELEVEEVDTQPVFVNDTLSVVLFVDRASASVEESNAALNVLRMVARHYEALGYMKLKTADSLPSKEVEQQREPAGQMLLQQGTKLLALLKHKGSTKPESGGQSIIALNVRGELKEQWESGKIPLSLLDQIQVALKAIQGRKSRNFGAVSHEPGSPQQPHDMPNTFLDSKETKLRTTEKVHVRKAPSALPSISEAKSKDHGTSEEDSCSPQTREEFLGESNKVATSEVLKKEVKQSVQAELVATRNCAAGDDANGGVESGNGVAAKNCHDEHGQPVGNPSIQEFLQEAPNASISFFFWDGESQLKESLASSAVCPSLVVLHPQRGAHYVYPLDLVINEKGVLEFLDLILHGKLQSATVSQPEPSPAREYPWPPYVNDDFHEAGAVPRVTANNFESLVLGIEEPVRKCGSFVCVSNTRGPSENIKGEMVEKDVVVLFTTSWCGFCKRMELIFKELHHAIRRYLTMLDGGFESYGTHRASDLSGDILRSTDDGLPILLQMDCVLNDCSSRLKHVLQEEVYPSLVLFPAQRKRSPVVYDGEVTLAGVVGFLRAHGKSSPNLQRLTQGSWRKVGNAGSRNPQLANQCPAPELQQTSESSAYVVRNSRLQGGRSSGPMGRLLAERPHLGGFLIADEKLGSSPVFQSAVILVLSANEHAVWGVIVNKPLVWDNLVGFDAEHLRVLQASPVNYGGPSAVQGKPFLVLTRGEKLEGFEEVSPGLFFGGKAESAENVSERVKSGEVAADDVWLFLGSAVWGWQQLEQELAGGYWQLLSPKEYSLQWPDSSS